MAVPLHSLAVRRRRLLPYAAALAVVALDQASKALAVRFLEPLGATGLPLAGGVLYLRYLENTGAAFGLLQGRGPLLTGLALAIVGVLVVYYRTLPRHGPRLQLSLALILGGAAGNLLDRLRLGYVVDFIDLTAWPTFNLADAAVTTGVVILAAHLLLEGRENPRRHTQRHEQGTIINERGGAGDLAAGGAGTPEPQVSASSNRQL